MKILGKYYGSKKHLHDGEWKAEPDFLAWIDDETVYKCEIIRGPSGALCGYVYLHIGHPAYKKDLSLCVHDELFVINVHGGITYSGMENYLGDDFWVVGFDCLHSSDYAPRYNTAKDSLEKSPKFCDSRTETYRNIEYVINECQSLARQLKDLENER